MSAVITVPPAGWYEDDMVPGRERWWDGDRWTDRVRRTEFGLDCWASEQHRARTCAEEPAAHLAEGCRWTEQVAQPLAIVADAADVAAHGRSIGLAASTDAPLETWHAAVSTADEAAEIGPIDVQLVAIADLADTTDARWAAAAPRDQATRGSRAAKNKKRRDRVAETPRPAIGSRETERPAGGLLASGVGEGWAASAESADADAGGDAWVATPELAAIDAGWSDEATPPSIDREPDPAVTETVPELGTVPVVPDRMTGRPLADAAAVMAALAALSAPLDDTPAPATVRLAGGSPASTPTGSTAWSSSATANAAERAAARAEAATAATAHDSPKASEQEWAKEAAGGAPASAGNVSTDDRARRRSAPPRPSFAPSADGAGTPTSHTFTKIDREALDAAMALSSMLSPSSASRPPSPTVLGPRPAVTPTDTPPAPVAPVAVVEHGAADRPAESPAPVVRKDRPSRPAPPVPRWSDQQPTDDEADTGFVKISSRERPKRVLGN